jgi:predicted transcriptional regulator
MNMKKTSLYLDPETDRALERLSRARGITKAEAIRRALDEAVRQVERPRISAIGVGEGPGDVAADVDRHLYESGFGQA